MDIPGMTEFKNYLSDRPESALLALSLSANVFLYRAVIKAKDAHMAALEKWLPLVEKMYVTIEAATAAIGRRRQTRTSDPAVPSVTPQGQ